MSSAFSLIELIGVVAVISILAAATAPVVIRQIDQAARAKERVDLASISNAIVLQVLSTKSTPALANVPQTAASWARVAVNEVTTNRRRLDRRFLLDSSGFFGTYAGGYTQTWAGVAAVTNARAMVLGTIAKALPTNAGDFATIWNTPPETRPSNWTTATWEGRGEDLSIQRINLQPLFRRVVLINRDTLNTPRFAIDDSICPADQLPAGMHWDRYYLDGTMLSLCDSAGVLTRKVALTRDESFVFDGDTWRDYLVNEGGNEMLSNEFADVATRFMDIDWAPNAHQGADQQGTVVAMFNFMVVYTLWANQCPEHFPRHGITGQGTSVPEYQFLQQVGGSGGGINAFGRLGEFTGVNGLLDQ